jgi:hypothetical protein
MPFDRTLLPEPASYFASQGLTLKGPHRSPSQTTACSFHGGSASMRVNVINGTYDTPADARRTRRKLDRKAAKAQLKGGKK